MSGYKNGEEAHTDYYGFCSYPSCKHRKIAKGGPVVLWRTVEFAKEEVEDTLSPMGKLAVIANPSQWIEKFHNYGFNMSLHPECAAEWGMHLIQNALEADPNVGRTLSGRNTNAVRE